MKNKKFIRFLEFIGFIVLKNSTNSKTTINSINALCFLLFALCFLLYALSSEAKITGVCSNCHTMHNSQNGQNMIVLGPGETDTSPQNNLLRASCLGCHSKTDGSTWKDPLTGAPIVFNSVEPAYNAVKGLAAGNFYWVQTGDACGHNIFPANPDNSLTVAPGAVTTSCGTNSCHNDLYSVNTNYGTRKGCSKCHMMGNGNGPSGYHHKNTNGTLVESADEGWYRFLDGHQGGTGHGVTGIEDDDWQYTGNATDHNEYLGASGTKTSAGGFSALGNTMTAYCTGCHGNFHIEDDAAAGSPWIRHPSDLIIPNRDEYANAFGATAGTGTYDPIVPVARPSLSGWTGPLSTVTLDTDLVMCLSCHRAHASPYFKMVRWDYKGWPGNGEDNYCAMCHTSKQ